MHILNLIIEIITSPFALLLRSNGISFNTNKWCKPLIIFVIALVIVVVLVLFFYRDFIFK